MNCQQKSTITRVAYFTQEFIGDVLVWLNHIEALATHYKPCEITVFCSKLIKSILDGYVFADKVISYNPAQPWSREEIESFGVFDAVFNTRYDADSMQRVILLKHNRAYGFENVDIPEKDCKAHYDAYLPLTLWDDYRLRRETSVTAQGAELIKLIDPTYQCDYVQLDETTYVYDFTDNALLTANRIVFVLGASNRTKHWGTSQYISLALRMKERGYIPIFLLGPTELDYAKEIEKNGLTTFKNISFAKIATLFSHTHGAQCVVGNDTGLMHFACILGTPSVTIMPLGTHYTWFPYAKDERALHIACIPPCVHLMCTQECKKFAQCVDMITISAVEKGINTVLAQTSSKVI